MSRPAGISDVTICIATYKRASSLEVLLSKIADLYDGSIKSVIVVNNDPDASSIFGEPAGAAEFSKTKVHSIHEASPGIAAARNAAIASPFASELVAFIDDDEFPEPGWLEGLLVAMQESGACAAHGPVRYLFEDQPPDWAVKGGFYINPDFDGLHKLSFAATNNLMVDQRLLPAGYRLYFNNEYGLTGGSDIHWTWGLVEAGGSIVWAPRAWVTERVATERVDMPWLLRRAYRTGNTLARVRLDYARNHRKTRMVIVGSAAARVGGGLVFCLLGVLLRSSRRRGRGLRAIARGLGLAAGAVNRRYEEYSRN